MGGKEEDAAEIYNFWANGWTSRKQLSKHVSSGDALKDSYESTTDPYNSGVSESE